MPEISNDPQSRFLQRIERRARFLRTLQECGLGVYLPADERQRAHAIQQLTRATARHSELGRLTPATLQQAENTMRVHLEAMQGLLPHDVQYRNRIKRDW